MIHQTEVVIVGGSYAGLSAAMALGRSLRATLIIDSGKPCNRMTPHAHNFITQDGNTPDAIRAKALEQVLRYPTVQFEQGEVVQVTGTVGNFVVTTTEGKQIEAKSILFATGVKDQLPELEGVEACWGKTLIHCPYCHGYEVKEQPTGVWMNQEMALEYVPLIRHWTKEVVLLTDGPIDWDPAPLEKLGVILHQARVKALHHKKGQLESVVLDDGPTLSIGVLYYPPKTRQHCDIPQQLGCTLTETGHIQVNSFQQTTVDGIYAAGDCATPFRAVAQATAQGNTAGAFINKVMVKA